MNDVAHVRVQVTRTINTCTKLTIKAIHHTHTSTNTFIDTHMLHTVQRCYFRVTKFSRLAAQKHIRGLLNSR